MTLVILIASISLFTTIVVAGIVAFILLKKRK